MVSYSASEAAELLVRIKLEGSDAAKESIKELEAIGEHAAQAMEEDFKKVNQELMDLAGKAQQFGSVMTQMVTVPIAGVSVAAIAMTHDVLNSQEALAMLSEQGSQDAEALTTSIGLMKEQAELFKIEIAEGVMPVMTQFTNYIAVTALPQFRAMAEAWGEQSIAAKNTEIAILAVIALGGPMIVFGAQITTAVAAAKLAFVGLEIAAWGAYAAVGAVIAIVATAEYMRRTAPTEQDIMRAEGVSTLQELSALSMGEYGMRGADPGLSGLQWDPDAMGGAGSWVDREGVVGGPASFNVPSASEIAARSAGGGGGGGGGADISVPIPVVVTNWREGGSVFGSIANAMLPGGGEMAHQFSGIGVSPFKGNMVPAWYGSDLYMKEKERGHMAWLQGSSGMTTERFKFNEGDDWQANLANNDFLWAMGGQAVSGMMSGQSTQQTIAGMLPMIGSAFGPPGPIIGGILGGLLGRSSGKGDTPNDPVHVKVINPGDLATALSNVFKSMLSQAGAFGVNELTRQLHDQSLARNLS